MSAALLALSEANRGNNDNEGSLYTSCHTKCELIHVNNFKVENTKYKNTIYLEVTIVRGLV